MKTIEEGLNEAYKACGSNAYFGDGFKTGVKFAQQWISVEDELPEPNEEVFIKTDHGMIFNGVFSGSCWMQMDGVNGSSYVQIEREWEVIEWKQIEYE